MIFLNNKDQVWTLPSVCDSMSDPEAVTGTILKLLFVKLGC